MKRIVFCLYLFCLGLCVGDTTEHLKRAVSAIEKLVRYYNDHYLELNLDGIYGLRVLEGETSLHLFINDQYLSYHIFITIVINQSRCSCMGSSLISVCFLFVFLGQIGVLVDMYSSGQIHNHSPDWVWSRLSHLYKLSHNISEQATIMLQENEPNYYRQMQWLVDRPMSFTKNYRRLDPTLKWPSHVKEKGQWLGFF